MRELRREHESRVDGWFLTDVARPRYHYFNEAGENVRCVAMPSDEEIQRMLVGGKIAGNCGRSSAREVLEIRVLP